MRETVLLESSDGITANKANDFIREKTCTSKRAFESLDYCLFFADYLSNDQKTFDAYKCVFCRSFHLTSKIMTPEQVENLFSYHTPKANQIPRYNRIREKAKKLAFFIIENTPSSAEQTLAIRKLHESTMQANAAIACNE